MLRLLKIENIAVIESAEIELQDGFNVLTGETGAGKSILIDSINAVLGARASKDLIRTGEKKAYISALFEDVPEKCAKKLSENGINIEDGELLIERSLSADGKSTSRINGRVVLSALVREIAPFLIDIHGQHDNQRMLNSDEHYLFLDKFAENQRQKEEYYKAYKEFCSLKKQLDNSSMSENEKEARLGLLQYQINELENADVKIGEIDELNSKSNLIRNSERVLKALSAVNSALSEEINGVNARLSQAYAEISALSDYENISPLIERVNALQIEADDIERETANMLSSLNFDPDERERVEERLQMYRSFKRKYGGTEEEMLTFLNNAREELSAITFNDEKIEELENALYRKQEELVSLAADLTDSRRNSAVLLAERIENELSFLDMRSVRFSVEILPSQYTSTGCDKIQFLISANLGEEPKPLSKIASGGELSRIMLAIKNVFAEKDETDTLIFDEIDTGISGRAANKVGIKLSEIGRSHQILCVTHLAQIAAKAENHYLIEKNVSNGRTFTSVKHLDFEERKIEIARIIGGDITKYNLVSAEEMLQNS